MNKFQKWLLKTIRASNAYKILKEEIISNSNRVGAECVAKVEHAQQYFSDLDRTSSEVARLLNEQVMIATDIHFKSDTVIVVISKLGNGQVKFIPCSCKSIADYRELVKHLRGAFYVSEDRFIEDAHPYYRNNWR